MFVQVGSIARLGSFEEGHVLTLYKLLTNGAQLCLTKLVVLLNNLIAMN